jgi:two-component system phosphate regulon sensor histidine kinase PhoR
MKRRGKKNRQRTGWLIGLISLAVAGLLAVQLALLSMAWDLKDRAFRRNAVTALAETVRELEKDEIASDALQIIYRVSSDGEDNHFFRDGRWPVGQGRVSAWVGGEEYEDRSHELANLRRHFEFVTPALTAPRIETVLRDSSLVDATVVLRGESPESTDFWHSVTLDSFVTWQGWSREQGEQRVELIKHIVGDLVVATPRPIRERLQPAHIDSVLRENLQDVGIDIAPQFAVLSPEEELVLHSADLDAPAEQAQLLASPLRAELFPLDLRPAAHQILLRFPGQNSFLMRQIGPLLMASLLFLLVIIGTFMFTLRKIDQQNRFFVRVIDFINNMTHEFKTPISTVSLASEAIGRPGILERPGALERYNGMIRDENLRMRRQVEKILQIAQLESGEFDLNRTPVDMHELVRDTAEAFTLQIEDRGGTLELDLLAPRTVVSGDHVHLGNVVGNLLDNAIKYSGDQPRVRIGTTVEGGNLRLEVVDRGPGISRADQAQVFDKYFRSHTGDRHDVKGYGLGLSFVRLLVEAHGGQVSLESTPGQGTRVSFSLPLAEDSGPEGRTEN